MADPRKTKAPAPRKKPKPREPGLRDYLTSAANVALGVKPSSIARSGFRTGQDIGRYIRSTTPGEFGRASLAVAKAIPGALYDEVTSNFLGFIADLPPGAEAFRATREGARLRAQGRPAEAFRVERDAVPAEIMNFAPLGVLGSGAKRAVTSGARAVTRRLSRAPEVAFATSERVPYVNARHLPGLFEDEGARAAYSADPRASWVDEGGEDILYKALGVKQQGTRPATGFYRPPGKPGLVETNPATVGVIPAGEGGLSEAQRKAMDAVEATRAYFDTQGAGAWHAINPREAGGSLYIPQQGPVDAQVLASLSDTMGEVGLPDIVDTGGGITVSNFYPGPPTSEETADLLATGYRKALQDLTGARPRQVSVDSGYRLMFEGVDPSPDRPDYIPGSGRITGQLEELLSEYPEAIDMLDRSPEFRSRIASGRALDEEMAAGLGGANPYVQTARKIAAEGGLRGLFEARRQGVALPSIAALLSAYGLSGQDDGSGY